MVLFESLHNYSTDTIVFSFGTNEDIKLNLSSIPDEYNAFIKPILEMNDFKGSNGEVKILYSTGNMSKRIVLVGLGKTEKISSETIRRSFGSAGNQLRKNKIIDVVIYFTETLGKYAESVFEGIFLGNYRFLSYKTKKEDRSPGLNEIHVIVPDNLKTVVKNAYDYSSASIQGTILARELGNSPSNDATPTYLAEQALKLQDLGLKVTILDTEDIKKENMNLFLAVAQGSLESDPPKFIIIEYNPENHEKTICIVGKGITFDTGGISLKPGEGMGAMKFDMCGAAAVIGAMKSIALTKPSKTRVIGLVPATPNVPDANAYRPGDIITTRAGKKVEIISTDAEGRNILADALDYVKKYNPHLVFDIATLTGGAVVALGHVNAAFYLNEQANNIPNLKDLIYQVGRKTGDYCWNMPLDEEYFDYLKSSYADFMHSGGRWGSSVTAALFLKQFADYPWVHFDIAGVAWLGGSMGGKPKHYNSQTGATGFGVRFITFFVRQWN